MTIPARQFFPISRADFDPALKPNQRYRNYFNDLRLEKGVIKLVNGLVQHGSCIIAQCTQQDKDSEQAYRLLSNEDLKLNELIYQLTKVDAQEVAGAELLVPLDASSINLNIGEGVRQNWANDYGVIEDNRSAGFSLMPSLILDAKSNICYGMGDILIHKRKKAPADKLEIRELRKLRNKLAQAEKESSMWSRVATNTAQQLHSAQKVTFLMDQGADNYESWRNILTETGRDISSRMKEDRRATDLHTGNFGKLSQLLGNTPVDDCAVVEIKKLHHRSKSSGKLVKRKKRKAILKLKYIKIDLARPTNYRLDQDAITQPLYVVEVKEDAASVPYGEKPIHWRLLTSWELNDVSQAWKVVRAYCRRWDIEQLFRLLKKDGLNVEASQLGTPEKIEKLTVMALKAASLVLNLVAARDGEEFVDITSCFDEQEIQALEVLNKHYKGGTEKQSNPHDPASLAWAAWIIARAGGWKGYASQRKPGPKTMFIGIQKLQTYVECISILKDT